MAVSGPYRSSFDEILILDLYNLVLYKLNCIRKYLNKIKNFIKVYKNIGSDKMERLRPLNDFIFKKLFGEPESKENLRAFLNAILYNNIGNKRTMKL